jgi:hypothetical protein
MPFLSDMYLQSTLSPRDEVHPFVHPLGVGGFMHWYVSFAEAFLNIVAFFTIAATLQFGVVRELFQKFSFLCQKTPIFSLNFWRKYSKNHNIGPWS